MWRDCIPVSTKSARVDNMSIRVYGRDTDTETAVSEPWLYEDPLLRALMRDAHNQPEREDSYQETTVHFVENKPQGSSHQYYGEIFVSQLQPIGYAAVEVNK